MADIEFGVYVNSRVETASLSSRDYLVFYNQPSGAAKKISWESASLSKFWKLSGNNYVPQGVNIFGNRSGSNFSGSIYFDQMGSFYWRGNDGFQISNYSNDQISIFSYGPYTPFTGNPWYEIQDATMYFETTRSSSAGNFDYDTTIGMNPYRVWFSRAVTSSDSTKVLPTVTIRHNIAYTDAVSGAFSGFGGGLEYSLETTQNGGYSIGAGLFYKWVNASWPTPTGAFLLKTNVGTYLEGTTILEIGSGSLKLPLIQQSSSLQNFLLIDPNDSGSVYYGSITSSLNQYFAALPTSSAGLISGSVWVDRSTGGVLKIL